MLFSQPPDGPGVALPSDCGVFGGFRCVAHRSEYIRKTQVSIYKYMYIVVQGKFVKLARDGTFPFSAKTSTATHISDKVLDY